MNRILKVFSSGPEQDALAQNYSVIERYPAFVLLDVSANTAKKIARSHLTEDITSQYKIETSSGVIDTTSPPESNESGDLPGWNFEIASDQACSGTGKLLGEA